MHTMRERAAFDEGKGSIRGSSESGTRKETVTITKVGLQAGCGGGGENQLNQNCLTHFHSTPLIVVPHSCKQQVFIVNNNLLGLPALDLARTTSASKDHYSSLFLGLGNLGTTTRSN